jgi:hypothetical protein
MKTNKERFDDFKSVLDEIDSDYGFGPNEEIIDESKVEEYISNFVEYSKKIKVYDVYLSKLNENESKSLLERLYEI